MADTISAPCTQGEGREEEEDEDLICPVCQDEFKEPKFLPCHHCYCKSCVQLLIMNAGPCMPISCPECRTVTEIPNDDASQLPPAFLVNKLLDRKKKGKLQSLSPSPVATVTPIKSLPAVARGAPAVCLHHDEALDYLCTQCDLPICLSCTSTVHKGHACRNVETLAELTKVLAAQHLCGYNAEFTDTETSPRKDPVEMTPSMDINVKLRLLQSLSIGTSCDVKGDIFMFRGGANVGVVKILEPMSPMFNYFEYEIIDVGEKGAIGIGVGGLEYPLYRMPGWNTNGIGYHADDGCLFNQSGQGIQLGPTSTKGDRMGCGVDFDTDVGYGYVSVFFTRNGKQVSKPIKMKRPTHGLYPLVGQHSRGEKVRYLGHCRRLPDSVIPSTSVDKSPWVRSNGVKIAEDGLTLEYCGNGVSPEGQDIGSAQALDYCMEHGNHHFEMVIQEAGKGGVIAIGLAGCSYPLHVNPGSSKDSIAYHTNTGLLYRGDDKGAPFGPVCTEGDTVGCGIQCEDGPARTQGRVCNVFFTVNHQVVDAVQYFIPNGGFCPFIALLSVGAKVKVQFDTWTSYMERALSKIVAVKQGPTVKDKDPVEMTPSMDINVKLRLLQCLSIGTSCDVKGDIFMFRGGANVGVVKILEPMSPMFNYFEYEIIDVGEKGAIGIGVGGLEYPLDRMPGWNTNGIGYHADDGCLFNQSGHGIQLGPTSTKGDRMGCGVDFDTDVGFGYVSVFFTRNSKQVSKPIKMKRPTHGLYPLVGQHSRGETVRYLGHCRRLPDSVIPSTSVDKSPWVRSNGVKIAEDGLTLEYCGNGVSPEGRDIGSAQALDYCMEHGNHHFEMVIQEAGKGGVIAIGLAGCSYPLHVNPGSSKDSIAYHTNTGLLYRGNDKGAPFGPVCTEGDTVGCGIQCEDGPARTQGQVCKVFFTKNLKVIGVIECLIPEGGFYPFIAMLSHSATVRTSFKSLTSDIENALKTASFVAPRHALPIQAVNARENMMKEDVDSRKVFHPGVTCDACLGPVYGIRYKCTVCSNYDLCESCRRLRHHSEHPMITIVNSLQATAEQQEEEEGVLHPGVRCDGCSGPVYGMRYKCTICPDYDLCQRCKNSGIHWPHIMSIIRNPQQSTQAHRIQTVPNLTRGTKEMARGRLHPGVKCDVCEGPVYGTRYNCVECSNYDLCEGCKRMNRHRQHPMSAIKNAGDQCHFNVHCDGCKGGVYGTRFKCLQCWDYDLCWECKAKGLHSQHKMKIIQ